MQGIPSTTVKQVKIDWHALQTVQELQLTHWTLQPWQPVHALQCPVHTKHPVQLAQLPVQLPLQLVQLDAHLKVKNRIKEFICL